MLLVDKYIKVEGETILECMSDTPENISDYIQIQIEENISDIEVLIKYHYINGELKETTKYFDRKALLIELKTVQAWLKSNDWVPNKVVTGEWSVEDPRWIQYLSNRNQKRNRQDEITVLLSE